MSRGRPVVGASRWVRGVLVAGTSAALAAGAHGLAGGGLPDTASTVLLTALIGYVAAALAERTKGVPGVLAVLGAGQLVMHLLLTELGGHQHAAPVSGLAMTATHAVATLLGALLLTRAEHALRIGIARLRLLLPVVWRPAPVAAAAPRPVVPVPPVLGHLVGVQLRDVCARRGPPA